MDGGIKPPVVGRIPWREIDPGIKPLIRALNRAGFPTYMCCEGEPKGSQLSHEFPFAWISFDWTLSPKEVSRANKIIRRYTKTPFEWRDNSEVLFEGSIVGPDDFTIGRRYWSGMVEAYGPPEVEPYMQWLKAHYKLEGEKAED